MSDIKELTKKVGDLVDPYLDFKTWLPNFAGTLIESADDKIISLVLQAGYNFTPDNFKDEYINILKRVINKDYLDIIKDLNSIANEFIKNDKVNEVLRIWVDAAIKTIKVYVEKEVTCKSQPRDLVGLPSIPK